VYDFGAGSGMDPRAPVQALLFLTRWVARFCAPVFVFLAGTSAYLYGRGKVPADFSWFLLCRGLWLVLLELTVVRWGWTFAVVPHFVLLQVIWVIGWSMVALSVLHRLPLHVLAAFSLTMIAGHNLLDGVAATGWWKLVHGFGQLPPLGNLRPFVGYAFIPWIGVMSAGYCFGSIVLRPAEERRRAFLAIGLSAIAAFVVLRSTNFYGDPGTWRIQPTSLETAMAFVNTDKYPPSLLFLLMTLGPAILVLERVDGMKVGPIARPFVTFGRVPLFYYLLHLPLIHFVVLVAAWSMHGNVDFLLIGLAPMTPPEHDLPLPLIYGLWLATVLALLPACRWFAGVKQRRSDWWLRYL
jgi:uncharacterized membrane protein